MGQARAAQVTHIEPVKRHKLEKVAFVVGPVPRSTHELLDEGASGELELVRARDVQGRSSGDVLDRPASGYGSQDSLEGVFHVDSAERLSQTESLVVVRPRHQHIDGVVERRYRGNHVRQPQVVDPSLMTALQREGLWQHDRELSAAA